MSVGPVSRYNYAATIQVVDASGQLVEREHLDIRPPLQNVVHPDSQEFTPNEKDNWSRIGWRKLGDGRYWWIIADYSQILDPFAELRPQEKTKYLTRLSANVPAATTITSITVSRVKEVKRGDFLRIEDLDIAHAVSFDVVVQTTNDTTGVVTFAPVVSPAGGVPSALSRVSKVYKENVRLIIPSPHRAFFEALNFTNPLNILTET